VRRIASRGLLWVEGAIVLAVSASIAIYYFFSTAISVGIRIAFGGWYRQSHCCGFLGFGFFENFTRVKRMVFAGLFAVSVVIAVVGAGNPWART
jgi:hypothetical protein